MSTITSSTVFFGSHVRSLLSGILLVLAMSFSNAYALTLTSPAFAAGATIPNAFVFTLGGQCGGGNQSPPLIFGNVPDGTQSFALVLRDPDGGNWLHWKIWNIPATIDALPHDFSAITTITQANNDFGTLGYGGPCPPSGSHRYIFTLYALNVTSFATEPSEAQLAAAALQIATLTAYRSPTDNGGWTPAEIPQNGWWWNASESGRGYSIERNATSGNIFLAAYLYGQTGASTWLSAGLIRSDQNDYTGSLYQYAGGQSLAGAYIAPVASQYGTARLDPVDSTHALLTLTGAGTNPGMVVALRRFEFTPGSLGAPVSATAPESGWWWSAAESGRGYFLEIQQNTAFIATYMYNPDGTPVWYSTYNTMTSDTQFQGNLQLYANGQSVGAAYVAPTLVNGNVGTIQLQFSSRTAGTLTLPSGVQVPITRFAF